MTFVPHYSMTAIGEIAPGEIFTFGLSLAKAGIDQVGQELSPVLDPNDTVWADCAADLRAYWVACPINSAAVLKSVKFAPVGADGKYTGPPVEISIDSPTGLQGQGGATRHANQIALATTLHTAGDIGRVKGRFYLPLPGAAVGVDGLITEGFRDAYEAAAAALVTNLNNQPGIDVLNLKVVVASQGRRNSNGSLKIPPRNHEVTGVSVGRALDTIRTRRNALRELRGTPTAIA